MIKLVDILKEIKQEQNTQLTPQQIFDMLSPKQQEQAKKLAQEMIAKQEGITSGINIKNLTLPVIIAAFSFIQNATAQDVKNVVSAYQKDTIRTTTKEDGIIGSVTSTLKFPESVITNITIRPSGVSDTVRIYTGFTNSKKVVGDIGIDTTTRRQWNNFVTWMKKEKLSGAKEMNKEDVDLKVIKQYVKNTGIKDFFLIKGINIDDDINEKEEEIIRKRIENTQDAFEKLYDISLRVYKGEDPEKLGLAPRTYTSPPLQQKVKNTP